MNDLRRWGTIATVLVAVVFLTHYVFDFVTGQRLPHIDNFILLSGWILMCLGILIFLWSRKSIGKVQSTVLILCKLLTTVIVGVLEEKELLILKTFWTDLVITAFLVALIVYYSFLRPGRNGGQ